jgi:hypothetical protein
MCVYVFKQPCSCVCTPRAYQCADPASPDASSCADANHRKRPSNGCAACMCMAWQGHAGRRRLHVQGHVAEAAAGAWAFPDLCVYRPTTSTCLDPPPYPTPPPLSLSNTHTHVSPRRRTCWRSARAAMTPSSTSSPPQRCGRACVRVGGWVWMGVGAVLQVHQCTVLLCVGGGFCTSVSVHTYIHTYTD